MLETQDYFRGLCVGRTNYIICGAQCRMKMPAPCSKIIKNFRKTLNQACVTAQVTHSMSQPCSFCHAPCWMSSITTYFLRKAQNHLFSVTQNFLTTRTQPGMEVLDTQDKGSLLSGPWNLGYLLFLSHFSPSTQTNLWTPSCLGVWQPWCFSILPSIFLWDWWEYA